MTTALDSERASLLRSVLEDPFDDLRRLVFADWCDDQGDADRATFIRCQVAYAKLPPLCDRGGFAYREGDYTSYVERCRCRPCTLRRKAYYAGRRHTVWEWCRGIPAGSGNVYRRGFVEAVSLNMESFLLADGSGRPAPDIIKAVFAHHPVTSVTFTNKRPWTHEVFPGSGRYRSGWNLGHSYQQGVREWLKPHWPKRSGPPATSRDGAVKAGLEEMSQAFVGYARQLVGLPPLVGTSG